MERFYSKSPQGEAFIHQKRHHITPRAGAIFDERPRGSRRYTLAPSPFSTKCDASVQTPSSNSELSFSVFNLSESDADQSAAFLSRRQRHLLLYLLHTPFQDLNFSGYAKQAGVSRQSVTELHGKLAATGIVKSIDDIKKAQSARRRALREEKKWINKNKETYSVVKLKH